MSIVLKPPQLRFQPQGACVIDRTNRLGQSVTFAIPMNGQLREVVLGRAITMGAGGSYVRESRGVRLTGNGTQAVASVPVNLGLRLELSVSFWMYWDAFANDDDLAMEYTPNYASGNHGWIIVPNSGAPTSGNFQISTSTQAASVPRPSAAAWHHYVINFNRRTNSGGSVVTTEVFIDTIQQVVTLNGTTGSAVNFTANSTLFLFSRNNASLFGAGRMQNLLLRDGYRMSQAEVLHEYLNPWAMYKNGCEIRCGRDG